jgi:hypothetical protein
MLAEFSTSMISRARPRSGAAFQATNRFAATSSSERPSSKQRSSRFPVSRTSSRVKSISSSPCTAAPPPEQRLAKTHPDSVVLDPNAGA